MPHLRVGVLGATGAVGQKFVELLEDHPWFEIAALAASERSAGKPYAEATNWIGASPIPEGVRSRTVTLAEDIDGLKAAGCDFVFSGLDNRVAGDIERACAEAGLPVVSNAKNHRMHADVPLLVPEVNPDHASLIQRQNWGGEKGGFIVTNPNCSTVGLVCALRPLHDAFGIEAVQVTTMQAISGAGYPGVSALDILGNVVPFIGGEEEKMATETNKLLGTLGAEGVASAGLVISAQCNRVPVLDGHLECVSLRLKRDVSPVEAAAALRGFRSPLEGLGLPSDALFIHVFDDERFPQPRRHSSLGRGLTVSVGRVRVCPVLGLKFVVLSHNTVRGAAGVAVLNAELLVQKGYLTARA